MEMNDLSMHAQQRLSRSRANGSNEQEQIEWHRIMSGA